MMKQYYRPIGNALHVAVLASIAIYSYAIISQLVDLQAHSSVLLAVPVLQQSHNNNKLVAQQLFNFDPHWLEYGFCMPHPEIPHYSTHEQCGYFMILMSILGFLLLSILKDPRSTTANAKERVHWALIGALGHAAGHIILAITKRHGLLPDNGNVSAMDEFLSDNCTWITYAKHIPSYFLFYIPLVKTYMYNVSSTSRQGHGTNFTNGGMFLLASVSFLMMVGAMQFPLKFGFSYVLIVLFAGQSIDQLVFLPREDKDNALLEYMLWPMVTLLPNFWISVMESQWCTTSGSVFGKHGHLIFDGYMVISYIVYYIYCVGWEIIII